MTSAGDPLARDVEVDAARPDGDIAAGRLGSASTRSRIVVPDSSSASADRRCQAGVRVGSASNGWSRHGSSLPLAWGSRCTRRGVMHGARTGTVTLGHGRPRSHGGQPRASRDGRRPLPASSTTRRRPRSRRSSREGATGASSLAELVAALPAPARRLGDGARPGTSPRASSPSSPACSRTGDCLIDGGNSYYRDDIRRAEACAAKGIDYLDVGTSGGVWGLERGYCLMIGGPDRAVDRLSALWDTIAPGVESAPRTPGPQRRADPRGARLAALRPERRRPLREDGAQRHRVRPHGRLRRGAQRPQARERRQGRARRRRRDRAAERSAVLPVRHRPARGRRGVAPRQRRRLVAARPDRERAARLARPGRVRRPGVRLRRGALDVRSPRSRRACRPRC